MFWHDRMGFVGWWGVGLWMLLFWALVIAAIVLVVRWASGQRSGDRGVPTAPTHHERPPDPGATRPQQILDERFARGEIDEAEYRHRRDVLRGGPPPPA